MAGIYVHIPFCKQACTYCNFHFSTSIKLKNDLVQALIAEIALQRDYLKGEKIDTIYFGGGTPSLLSAEEINLLTDEISNYFDIQDSLEFTLEANPDDLKQVYINSLKSTSVNRLSIGVQSFFDHDLTYMNRAHNEQEADYAIKAAQDAGFENLTIDLIYGTPGLTDKNWIHNLTYMNQLGIPHFSSYALTVEEGTALDHQIRTKKSAPVDVEQSAHQFEILMDKAEELGYEHYEISNLAKEGHRAIHNTNYWLGVPYLGIGPSAHSFDGTNRRWNVAHNPQYIKSILAEQTVPFEEEYLTDTQRLNEYLMTALRTVWGIDKERVSMNWGSDTLKAINTALQPYIDNGHVTTSDNSISLNKSGKLIADKIASDLFLV